MRVVLLPSAYLPRLGGVEVVTSQLAAALARSGATIEVWTSPIPGEPRDGEVDGVAVRRFDFAMPSRHPRALLTFPWRFVATLVAMLRQSFATRPDVLHVHCFSGNGVYALALACLTRIPLVVTLHGETAMDDHAIYDRSAFLRAALRLAARRADVVTGCSRFALDDAQHRVAIKPRRTKVVFNAVGPPPDAVVIPAIRSPFVLAVGRAVKNKGFDLLIDAFSLLSSSRADLQLVIGGDGPALPDLRSDAERRGVAERTRFLGRLEPSQVATLMRRAAVLVVPSRLEPFGVVVLEGWRARVPVVVTNRGGPPEFVDDDRDGIVVDPLDAAALAGAISRVLDDRTFAAQLVDRAQQRLEAFGWEEVATTYLDLYREAKHRRLDRTKSRRRTP